VSVLPAFAAEQETDKETGLIIATGFEQVKETCTVCHSPMLITQNKADRDGWLEMIRWMQAKQGLKQLDADTENAILDYLATNYGPTDASRRAPLEVQFPE
jgi:cytochrome c5